jgi:hypothetical protein
LAFLAEFEFVYLSGRQEFKKELLNRWYQLLQVKTYLLVPHMLQLVGLIAATTSHIGFYPI